MIEKVEKKVQWFRSFSKGEKRTGQFASPKECHSLSVILSRWNLEEGSKKGIRLCASYNVRKAQVTLTAK